MGNILAGNVEQFDKKENEEKIFDYFPSCKMIFMGLDGAGKTTILNRLNKNNPSQTSLCSVRVYVESLKISNVDISYWDNHLGEKVKPLFKHIYEEANVVIFVVDSNDKERFEETKECILSELRDKRLKETFVLVLANKQDLNNSLKVGQIIEELELNKIQQNWFIQPCSGKTGEGLQEGFYRIYEELKKKTYI
eukprot:gene4673-8245_t